MPLVRECKCRPCLGEFTANLLLARDAILKTRIWSTFLCWIRSLRRNSTTHRVNVEDRRIIRHYIVERRMIVRCCAVTSAGQALTAMPMTTSTLACDPLMRACDCGRRPFVRRRGHPSSRSGVWQSRRDRGVARLRQSVWSRWIEDRRWWRGNELARQLGVRTDARAEECRAPDHDELRQSYPLKSSPIHCESPWSRFPASLRIDHIGPALSLRAHRLFLDGPGRREATGCGQLISSYRSLIVAGITRSHMREFVGAVLGLPAKQHFLMRSPIGSYLHP
jgi:hypothetical protein